MICDNPACTPRLKVPDSFAAGPAKTAVGELWTFSVEGVLLECKLEQGSKGRKQPWKILVGAERLYAHSRKRRGTQTSRSGQSTCG